MSRIKRIFTAIIAVTAMIITTSTAVEAFEQDTISEATAASSTEETTPRAPKAPIVVSSFCVGEQDEIDTCVGATYYAPIADYLGVPYYAQHNGKGGEEWLTLEVGDEVIVDGAFYHVSEIRTVKTGGELNQIADMNGRAYLQTCLDDNVIYANVYALNR